MGIGPVRFTIHDALQMVERGILPEDSTVELLDGELVHRDRFDLRGDEIVEGVRHNYVITALGDLQVRVNDSRRHMRTQSTLICTETHAPIPDAVVLRGTLADYRDRLPAAADAWCVVEVADSSYERDTGEKLAGYARAGVTQYVVVNLRNRTAEVYTNPDTAAGTYPAPRVVREAEVLGLRVGEGEVFDIILSEVLP
jgi:Putative restriction endonuclease